jgi:hypothetical protein
MYKRNSQKKERRIYYDNVLQTWAEKEFPKELFCPTCRRNDWAAVNVTALRERGNVILAENQFEISEKLD